MNGAYETIRVRQDGPLCRIALDRPRVHNAIDGRMLRELREAFQRAQDDRAIHVLRLEAEGGRAFSAGIDVAYVKDLAGFALREVGRELHRTFRMARTLDKPIVAAIDGLCLGAGLELAISCDFMIATAGSRFGLPNILRGIPAIVEAALLPRAVGLQGARELAFTGRFWDADEALRRGLIHQVCAGQEFDGAVQQLCLELAEKSPAALATQKEIIHQWMCTDLEAAIDFSINTVTMNFGTADQRGRMEDFLHG